MPTTPATPRELMIVSRLYCPPNGRRIAAYKPEAAARAIAEAMAATAVRTFPYAREVHWSWSYGYPWTPLPLSEVIQLPATVENTP